MNERDAINSFAVQISRDIGSVDSHLRSIDEKVNRQAASIEAIWKKLDKCHVLHDKEMDKLKTKVYTISGMVAVIVTLLGTILKMFL